MAKKSALKGKRVLFTGKLAAMTRDEASAWVDKVGGENAGSVTPELDYLVIGDDGSFLFGAGTKGEKMLKAEKLIAKGCAISVISETDFLAMVGAPKSTAPPKVKLTVGPDKAVAPETGGTFEPTGKKFMFTGKLAAMTREEAKAKVLAIGGIPAGSVSKDLDYLVVGDQGSHLFGAGAKGEKILAAEHLQSEGFPVQIIAESAFTAMAAKSKAKPAKKKRA